MFIKKNNMKNLLICIIALCFIYSCKEEDTSIESCAKAASNYADTSGTITFNIEKENWYIVHNDIAGGSVLLLFNGSTNGDSAKIKLDADTLVTYVKINLDNEKKFNTNAEVKLYPGDLPINEFTTKTTIIVLKGTDTLTIPIESCTLKY